MIVPPQVPHRHDGSAEPPHLPCLWLVVVLCVPSGVAGPGSGSLYSGHHEAPHLRGLGLKYCE